MRLISNRSAVFLVVMTLLVAACGDGGTSDTTAAPDEGATTTAPAGTEAPATTAAPSEAAVTLTFLVDDTQNTIDTATALADAFTAQNPDVAFEIETRPGGGEGDNIVKTRLATGEMTDIFWYNSGSLFQALNPTESLVPITDEAYVENIVDSFLPTVTANGDVYGVPAGTALGGGVLYNKAIYEELGLSVPTTWEEFAANNQAILDAGTAAPVGQTYMAPDTWTSQLFILADYYNVQMQDPDWAEKYTNNQAKYVDQPALTGFQRLQEGFESGWYQEDFGSATFDDGLNMLATGEIAHYPMLSFALEHDCREPSRRYPGHRLLRAAGQRCRHQWIDDLDAGGHLHRRNERASGRRKGVPWVSSPRSRGRRPRPRRLRLKGHIWSRVRHFPPTRCRRCSTSRPISIPETSHRRWSSCRRSRAPTWSSSPLKSDPVSTSCRGSCCRSTTKT